MGIGSITKKLVQEVKTDVQKAEKTVENAASNVVADVQKNTGWLAQGPDKGVIGKVKDGFINLGGAAVGAAELGAAEVGINHLYPVTSYQAKVSNGLSRGSRIDNAAGYQALVKQGFKTTVDLRAEGPGDQGLGAKGTGLRTLRVPIVDNTPPTDGQMKQFLDFVTNKENQPAYVHCEAGVGRTGTAVACYRMAAQGWPPEKALAEAVKMGDAVPDQQSFILQFGKDLAAGKIAGYPLKPPVTE